MHVGRGLQAFFLPKKRYGAVFSHDGVYRPRRKAQGGVALGKRLAPADWATGDGNHMQAGSLQRYQRMQSIWRDGAIGGERVVNVGEDAGDAAPRGQRPEF